MSSRNNSIRGKYGSKAARFDEQRWPVTVVLVLLAICVGGLIIAKGNFTSHGVLESAEKLARNAWVQLLALVVIIAASLRIAVAGTDLQVRRMQFSIGVG